MYWEGANESIVAYFDMIIQGRSNHGRSNLEAPDILTTGVYGSKSNE
jgi:hypothetical protein